MKKEILGIIPAKGWSKGVQRKNLRLINGKSLIEYSIEEAKKSKYLTRLIVSTEDEEIKKIAESYGVEVPFKEKSHEDFPVVPNLIEYILEELKQKEDYYPDIIVSLEPTKPLRKSEDIDRCISRLLEGDVDMVTTISETDVHPYRTRTLGERGILNPVIDTPLLYAIRQKLPKTYFFNGAVYAFNKEVLESKKNLRELKWAGIEIAKEDAVDIDTEKDFKEVEKILNKKKPHIKIKENKEIGKDNEIYLILEIGRTYKNDIEKAKEMIRIGAESGADAIKIQSINPEGLLILNEKNKEYYENLKKLQRSKEEHEILKRECEKHGLDFISTPETLEMVDLLESIGVDIYKISSLDLVYHKMIKKIAQKNKPIILSTGMATHEEILETVSLIKSLGNEKIILMHCVSLYPPRIDELNLEMLENIKIFGIVPGFSDHTPDIEASLCAIGRGARIIEKHFKINDGEGDEWKGDYDVAITPEQVKRLKLLSRQILEKNKEKKIINEEETERRKVRGRKLILNKDLNEGEIITEDILDCKQNLDYGGVDCVQFKKFVGKRISRNKKRDELLQEQDILERIFVTGAGGDSGLCVIRILKEKGYYVHAGDSNLDSSGLYLADSFSILPSAEKEEEFINEIKRIVIEKKIDVIFPNVDEELKIFSKYKEEIPCKVIISPYKTIEICQNKLQSVEFLKEIVPIPHTNRLIENFPLIVRPIVSRGSRNVFKVNNERERDFFWEYLKNRDLVPMIQEFLPGVEYTIDVLFDLDGNFVVGAPRKRVATKGGASLIGETEKNEILINYVKEISKKMKFIGPINFQFKEDREGVLKFLEINPRFSGGLTITYKNGLNIPELILKISRGDKINEQELNYKEGKVYRYLSEIK